MIMILSDCHNTYNVEIKFIAHDMFLEKPLSGKLNIKIWESKIIKILESQIIKILESQKIKKRIWKQ